MSRTSRTRRTHSILTPTEGPAVPAGKLRAPQRADPGGRRRHGQVHAIDNVGNVTHNAFNFGPLLLRDPENVNVVPEPRAPSAASRAARGQLFPSDRR